MTKHYITNLVDYLEDGAVRSNPNRICFRDQDRTYTLIQIRKAARQIGTAIAARANVYNCPVAVYLPKSAESLIADLGIFYSGNFYLNLDIQAPIPRLKALLQNVEPVVYLTTTRHIEALRSLGVSDTDVLEITPLLENATQTLNDTVLDARRKLVLDTDPACIINTSGSTGVPKSAVLSHQGLIDFMEWHQQTYPILENDVIGSLSPFHFDGYIVGFFSAIWQGAQLVVIPGQLAMFPVRLAEYLRDQGITFIFWVPTIMVNMANADVFASALPTSLRHVGFAGEVFPIRHLNYWRRYLPHARFVNYYGPIEVSVICTHYEVKRDFKDDEYLPIGFACENTDILILNEENCICKPSEHGELCVRGCSLAYGYWNNFDATSKVFVQNPLNKHFPEKIYRTGDVVCVNDCGEIVFVGRKDFEIKHQGYRIELGEIENACLTVLGLRNACVLYQRERKEIALFYESDNSIEPAIIRKELARTLPKYMLPTVFHHLETMPLNPNGKIDRKILAECL